MWFVEVRQIANNGRPTGKFRLVARSDEPMSGPFGLCVHSHDTRDEAWLCEQAVEESKKYG